MKVSDKVSNTAYRLKIAMELRGFKQVDLIAKTNINKGALSSYLSGRYEPKQNNIYKLAQTLNVSEAWLMGYDVPMERQLSINKNHSNANKPVSKTKNIPLVGTVACGNPIYAEENIQEYISVDINDNVDFALHAQGDSMNNCKIDDNDIVYIRQQSIVNNGEIALVLVGDSATIKRFFDYGDKIVLRPDSTNPIHQEQIYDKSKYNLIIQGKVIFIKTFIH